MKYLIHNSPAGENIEGLQYSVIVFEKDYDVKNRKVPIEGEKSDIIERFYREAGVNTAESHEDAIVECFSWLIVDAIKRGSLNDIQLEFNINNGMEKIYAKEMQMQR